MNLTSRVTAAALAGALLAACSGGNSAPSGSLTPSQAFHWTGPVAKLKIHVFVPARKQWAAIKALAAKHGVSPNVIPGDTTTVKFSLYEVNTGFVSGPTPFDFSLTTPSSQCPATGSGATAGFSCSTTTAAPVGSDTFQVVAEDAVPNKLSETAVTVNVTQSGASGSFTLNPIVAGVAWVSGFANNTGPLAGENPGTFANGSGTPVWGGSSYTCPTPANGGCYDPIIVGGTPEYDTLTLQMTDARGETIIPVAGALTPAAAPYKPIYLTSGGSEDNVIVTCSGADVEWLAQQTNGNVPITPPVSNAALALIANPNTDLANGATSAAGTKQYQGPGNVNGGNVSFNSPLNLNDTATVHQGTDFGGNQIADGFYGNNGGYINWDGGANRPSDGSLQWECAATEAGGHVADFFVGYAVGSIIWSGNLKIHKR